MRVAAQWRRLSMPERILLVVCVLHGISPLVLVGVHQLFGHDETVYLSQINGFIPGDLFTAPRARGLTLIVAPVTLLTTSIVAIRVWLAAVTAVLMYVGFRPWLRLVPAWTVPVAAALFNCLWTTIFFGFEAMPNIYVALGALPAVALVVAQLREPVLRWGRLIWLAVAGAFISLIRPSDALAVIVVLVATAVLTRGVTRRVRIAVATAASLGFVLGALEWVIEAYVRFGGPAHRLALAQAEQGTPGLHFSLVQQVRVLSGPILCRTGCQAHVALPNVAWWIAAALFVVVGLWASRGSERRALRIATLAGLAVMAEYVFTIPYGAPRFMLPTYMLLSLPAAAGVMAVIAAARRLARPLAATIVTATLVLVAGFAGAQVFVLRHQVLPETNLKLERDAALARIVRADAGVRPCILAAGRSGAEIAYLARCALAPNSSMLDQAADSGRELSFFLTQSKRLPASLAGWEVRPLPADRLEHHWYLDYDYDATMGLSAAASRS